ncbi:dihydroorotate dehydrogenase [Arcanobacterium hippocoleae]|uniref:Dihydroorotate dehydrogenase n=1 Tax=Arcanobacterium hippocoleae TaxID=149017 RepID=A0ABU1T1I8_9ACTO|nr:dihydroorotate dehydrogenase [Arcanobacterium hippocoleae]MDR6939169.1 dihydroorotate dehydrogenase (NAD+) catalytic subunit [Arcanobacterium hippocoleae]
MSGTISSCKSGITEKDRLTVELCGIKLANPIIPASGTFGFGAEFARLWDINELGTFSFKGTTAQPREGNAQPRVADAPGGMLNAIGLANPGVEEVLEKTLPNLEQYFHKPVMANVAGFSLAEFRTVAQKLSQAAQVGWLEINISCPNVHEGGKNFADDPQAAAEVCRAVKEVTDKPVIMKLAPNAGNTVETALACQEAGADALSLVNTFVGMRLDLRTGKPILANRTGGVSGPGIFPIALRMVWDVSRAVNLPVVGIGGVKSAEDVIEMMHAGACAVQIGTANLLDPYICRDIIRKLPQTMDRLGISCLADLNPNAKPGS